jgi:hypothetical protein
MITNRPVSAHTTTFGSFQSMKHMPRFCGRNGGKRAGQAHAGSAKSALEFELAVATSA